MKHVGLPETLDSAEPMLTADAYAVFGYQCARPFEGADGCVSVMGSVTFFDDSGAVVGQESTPSVSGSDSLFGYSDGGAGVVVVGPEQAWLVAPGSVRDVASRSLGIPCMIPGRGVFYAEPSSRDPERPEDSLESFAIAQWSAEGKRTVLEVVPARDDSTPWPFCTPGGLIIEDMLFDGVSLVPLKLDPGTTLTIKSTVGVTNGGRVLRRDPVEVPGSNDPAPPQGRESWVGISADRATALKGGTEWSFVDIA